MQHIVTLSLFLMSLIITINAELPYWNEIQNFKNTYVQKKLNRGKQYLDNFNSRSLEERAGRGQLKCKIIDTLGLPVPYKDLYLIDEYGYTYGSKTSSDSGIVTFINIFPGKYSVYLEMFNSYDEFYYFLGNTLDANTVSYVDVTNGTVTDAGTIIYNPSLFQDPVKDSLTINGTIKRIVDKDTIEAKCEFNLTFRKVNSDGTLSWGGAFAISSEANGYFNKKIALNNGEYYALVSNITWENGSGEPLWINGETLKDAPTSIIIDGDIDSLEFNVRNAGAIFVTLQEDDGDSLKEYVRVFCISDDGKEYGDEGINSSTDTIKFTGLPAGKYYLKTDYSAPYSNNWYYPGTSDIKNAQLIDVSPNEIDTINFLISDMRNRHRADEASVNLTIYHPNGTLLPLCRVGISYLNKDGYSSSKYINNDSIYVATVDENEPFNLYVEPHYSDEEKVYISKQYYNKCYTSEEAVVNTLAADEVLNVNINLEWGGSVAGFVKDKNGNKINGGIFEFGTWHEDKYSEWCIGSLISLYDKKNNNYVLSDIIGNRLPGGYRVGAISIDSCNLQIVPLFVSWEGKENALSISPTDISGVGNIRKTDVVISDTTTTIVNFNPEKMASGIIKSHYNTPTGKTFDSDMFFYAIDENGQIQSLGYILTDLMPSGADTSILSFFYDQDYYTLKLLDESSSMQKASVILPQLYMGEYYVAAGLYDANSEQFYLHWYGLDTIIETSNNEDFIDEGTGFLNIPAGAKKVNISTDSSVVTIDFYNTSIFKNFKHASTILSDFNNFGNIICFKYNLTEWNENTLNVKLVNFSGRTIYDKKYSNKKGQILINAAKEKLANGVYMLNLKAGNKSISRQVKILK